MKKLRIMIADDHDLVARGVRTLVEQKPGWKVCAVAETGPQAVECALAHRPDVAVVDLDLPGLNGLEVTRQIKERLPACEILIFTGSSKSDASIREAFAGGAKSYILKTEVAQCLVEAIESLGQHKPYFTERVSEILFARFARVGKKRAQEQTPDDERLSPGERSVVQLLAGGHSNASVAKKKRLSVRTVENVRAGIMAKLKLASFADLVRYAARNGLIEI